MLSLQFSFPCICGVANGDVGLKVYELITYLFGGWTGLESLHLVSNGESPGILLQSKYISLENLTWFAILFIHRPIWLILQHIEARLNHVYDNPNMDRQNREP